MRYKAVSGLIFASMRLARCKSYLTQNKKLLEVNFASFCSSLLRLSTLVTVVNDDCTNYTSQK